MLNGTMHPFTWDEIRAAYELVLARGLESQPVSAAMSWWNACDRARRRLVLGAACRGGNTPPQDPF